MLFVPCATDGTIDVLRTKIQDFCNALSFDGRIKVVILDELDSASSSGDSNFQKGLRTLIEANQDTVRFICTANYDKIIEAVTSRCTVQELRFSKQELFVHLKKILDAEKITYTKETLSDFILQTFKFYPDCRRIVNYLQFCCNDGTLNTSTEVVSSSQKENFIAEVVDKTVKAKSILEARQFYMQNKSKFSDFIEAGSLFFNYVADNGLVDSDGILKLVDLLYQLNVVIDKEPTFFGMLVALKRYHNGIQKQHVV